MKIVKLNKVILTKQDFEKKLNIKIKSWILPEDDNFLKIYSEDKIIYLRCSDITELFGIDVNIFDEDVQLYKDKITLKDREELYRGKVKPLNKIKGI